MFLKVRCEICHRGRDSLKVHIYHKHYLCQTCQSSFYAIFRKLYPKLLVFTPGIESKHGASLSILNAIKEFLWAYLNDVTKCSNTVGCGDYALLCDTIKDNSKLKDNFCCKHCRFRMCFLLIPHPPKLAEARGDNEKKFDFLLKEWVGIVESIKQRVVNFSCDVTKKRQEHGYNDSDAMVKNLQHTVF